MDHTRLLGDVRVYPAWWKQRGFIYLFSGAQGWSEREEGVARQFARAGQRVVGVDAPQFLRWTDAVGRSCVDLAQRLETYSRTQQERLELVRYEEPTLLGENRGAALVDAALEQSMPLAFSAAVMVDPEQTLSTRRGFCDVDHHESPITTAVGSLKLVPEVAEPTVPVRVFTTPNASPALRQYAAALTPPSSPARSSAAPLLTIYRDGLTAMASEHPKGVLAALPLVEVAATGSESVSVFAVLYSGDGGWRDLDSQLAAVLAAKGVHVVGVDDLRYYWHYKSPTDGASDLGRIIRYYQQRFGIRQVALIGFSFGADVLPFLTGRLDPQVRADVVLLSLLSPQRTTPFEIQSSGLFDLFGEPEHAIGPELQQLSALPVQCIYGHDEGQLSLCTTGLATRVQLIEKSGGHHLDGNYDALANEILAALPR